MNGDGRMVTMTPTWYVTFECRSHVLPKPRSPRETRTFATEVEAKLFARSKFSQGLVVFAGTLNPFHPKRVVPSTCIQIWLAEDEEEAS